MTLKVKCAYCKEYVERDSAYRNGLQSFCSNEHYRMLMFDRSKPQKKKSIDLSSDEKLHIIELDGYSCRFCNAISGLHVHHIKYRSEGGSNNPSNLITLCYKHHNTIHSNKKRYQQLCEKIVEIREIYSHNTLTLPNLEILIQENSLENYLYQLEKSGK